MSAWRVSLPVARSMLSRAEREWVAVRTAWFAMAPGELLTSAMQEHIDRLLRRVGLARTVFRLALRRDAEARQRVGGRAANAAGYTAR